MIEAPKLVWGAVNWLPIAAALATSIGVHPYFLMIPAVIAKIR